MMKAKAKRTLTTIIMTLRRVFQGHFPTSDEIENSKIKSLASRLKAESYEETLTNILEWQNRNIEFWTERHPIPTVLNYLGVIFMVGFLISSLSFVFLVAGNIQLLLLVAGFILIWFGMLVGSAIATLTIIVVVLHSNRKIPWREIPRCLKNIFLPNISIEFLLEKKLGVCRDYAKLTACLLTNIYPNEKIYFAYAPSHAATGIMIENRLYMLDQRLPILTIEKWSAYRKPKRHDIERFDFVDRRPRLQKIDKKALLRTEYETEKSIDTRKLAVKMEKLLNIREQTGDKAASLLEMSITWKKGAILYEDNEMVDYSLARRLEMEIPNELVGIDQITRIEVERRKDDLMFQIRFSQNR
jgi:predicted transglutaminase-like protease